MLEMAVDIPNEAAWRSALADLERGEFFRKPRKETLEGAGILVLAEARKRVPRAFGTLHNSLDYELTEDSVKVGVIRNFSGPSGRASTAEYGYYVEKGRSAGAMPPPAVLRNWMARVGYTGSEFLLRKTIAEKGIRPQPFLAPALESQQGTILKIATTSYQNGLNAFANRVGGGIFGRIAAFFRGFFG